MWGATIVEYIKSISVEISIHAPRVGRDDGIRSVTGYSNISIHAPRVGRDNG